MEITLWAIVGALGGYLATYFQRNSFFTSTKNIMLGVIGGLDSGAFLKMIGFSSPYYGEGFMIIGGAIMIVILARMVRHV